MLRPGPVEAAFAAVVFALQRLAVLINRREHLLGEIFLPARRGGEDPLDFLVAADLDDGGLMARRDDDGIIGRVIVDGVDVCPVAARTNAGDVAERIILVHGGELFSRKRLAGLRSVDIEAHRTLVKRLNDNVAIRIENFEEAEIINHVAVLIDFSDHVADRVDTLAVGTTVVGRGDAQEKVAVLSRIKCVREVGITRRQTAVKDFAAHQVVLGIALAVAEREEAVLIHVEAHHDAGVINRFRIIDRIDEHVPTDFARRINDGVLRIVVPFKCAAGGVVPHHAGLLRSRRKEIVDQIEAVFEFRINLDHFRFKHVVMLSHRTVDRRINSRRVDAVLLFLNAAFLTLVDDRIAHFDRVVVVRVKTEHRNAGVRAQKRVCDLVADFLSALLRNHADRSVFKLIAAVLNDRGERSDLIGVDDDFTDLTRGNIGHGRAGSAAGCLYGGRETKTCGQRNGEGDRGNLCFNIHSETTPLKCHGSAGCTFLAHILPTPKE